MTEETKEKEEKKASEESAEAASEGGKKAEEVEEEIKEKPKEKTKEKPAEKPKEKPAPTGKYKDLIKQIESLSLIELSELVKELEERFGVSGMPMAMPAAGTAATSGASAEAGAPEGKSKFEVVLSSSGGNKIAVIKAVREIKQDLGLKEAKDLVEAAPKTLLPDASKEDAEKAKEKLEAAGATVELK